MPAWKKIVRPEPKRGPARGAAGTNVSRRAVLGFAGGAAGACVVGCSEARVEDSARVTAAVSDDLIVRAAIHPGIGVARVGNSDDAEGFFAGPEVVFPPPVTAGESRDEAGALKRQAARFRIYGYNAAGEVVKEITADNAHIQWQVHLANKKAQWYRFLVALDIPEASTTVSIRRNAHVAGGDRHALAIDPGPRKITSSRAGAGREASGDSIRFDGQFAKTPVTLGELRTDERGRLLVLGGHGRSGSPNASPIYDETDAGSFNNADGWFDDIADGPVSAQVTIAGRGIPVDAGWVIVGPPNYAPNAVGWRTLYDLLLDTYVESGMLPVPETTSFVRDVHPVLRRLTQLQWVNKGFALAFGHGGPFDFDDPKLLERLAYKGNDRTRKGNAELRQKVWAHFQRTPETSDPWPPIYGDAYGSFAGSSNTVLAVSNTRLLHLKRWAEGNFREDWAPDAPPPPRFIGDVPLADQPAMLDQAALHFCVAHAFHPGCEVTWPMRHASLYRAPFRIKARNEGELEPDYGDELTAAVALGADGPLGAQGPGDLTRWMALPWQGDTIFCRAGYEPAVNPYLPTFWPARVPNHVLSQSDYETAIDTSLPRGTRLEAFTKRESWGRSIKGSAPEQMMKMTTAFGTMGVVEGRPGVEGEPDFPRVMFVESGGFAPTVNAEGLAFSAACVPTPRAQGGWESDEQLEEFRRMRRVRPW